MGTAQAQAGEYLHHPTMGTTVLSTPGVVLPQGQAILRDFPDMLPIGIRLPRKAIRPCETTLPWGRTIL